MKQLIIAVAFLSVLSACGKRADEPENNPAAHAGPTSAGQSSTANANSAKVTFEPATFESCTPTKHVVAKISWDANSSGAKIVDVKAVGPDGSETLFTTAGPVGSKETGPWVVPGSAFVVRNHDTGAELGRGTAAAAPCSS